MSRTIIVLDPGSSSLKFGLYRIEDEPIHEILLAFGEIDRLGATNAELRLEVAGQPAVTRHIGATTAGAAAEVVLEKLQSALPVTAAIRRVIDAIGFRVVHGGDRFVEPTVVTTAVIKGIRELGTLAPLHNPVAADMLEACRRVLPKVPAVAVFDTTFHRTIPAVARTYALPFELAREHGLQRFGFHGTAHRYVSGELLKRLGKVRRPTRCITCHLGSGASICALLDGKSIDTSMGMTPMEGLVMGTRSGDVDPGIILHLLRTVGMSLDELDDTLNRQSGLLGISGSSSDVRDLEREVLLGDARAELALEVFAYRAAKTIGAYAVALEGLDAIAFSGGIGENSPQMRQRICRRLPFLGVMLDPEIKETETPGESRRISTDSGVVPVWVIPADETLQIARETWKSLYETAL